MYSLAAQPAAGERSAKEGFNPSPTGTYIIGTV